MRDGFTVFLLVDQRPSPGTGLDVADTLESDRTPSRGRSDWDRDKEGQNDPDAKGLPGVTFAYGSRKKWPLCKLVETRLVLE